MLFLCTLQHLAVDGICGAALAAYAVKETYLEPILYFFAMYNLIAFGGQWAMGYVLDRNPRWLPYAFPGSLLCLGIGCVSSLGIFVQTILLGVGNCAFHVAAGSLVLRRYSTYRELGIFVSSGAVGLAMGINQFCSASVFVVIYAVAVVCFFYKMRQGRGPEVETCETIGRARNPAVKTMPLAMAACMALLLGCVALRGFGGGGYLTDYVMVLPCVFALGKILGGICCDRIGYKNTVVLIFLLGFLSLQWEGLLPALLLVLAFNMTMPLTLRLVHWCNPSRPGMMFGLAAGCLLPGAFYYDSFSMPPQGMLVIQFLCLYAAGHLFHRFGNQWRAGAK